MASNAQKTWVARTLNIAAEQAALDAIEVLGKALPAQVTAVQGAIVTVKFLVQGKSADGGSITIPTVTVPVAAWLYARPPIQAGDTGAVFPADVSLGGVSGLGKGTPQLGLVANLSALLFLPVSSSSWPAVEDPNAFDISGPNGVILHSTDGTVKIKITKTAVEIDAPLAVPITLNGNVIVNGNLQLGGALQSLTGTTYAGDIKTAGDVIAKAGAGQVGLSTHKHTQPNDSHGDTEGPTAAPTPGT